VVLVTRLAETLAALETDEVLAARQVRVHFPKVTLKMLEAEGVHTIKRRVRLTRACRVLPPPATYLVKNRSKYHSEASLRHACGLAEVRLQIGVVPSEWELYKGGKSVKGEQEPDAVWHRYSGYLAIEYDAGSYSPRTLSQKLQAFNRFSAQVWGAASEKRLDFLQELFIEQGKTVSRLGVRGEERTQVLLVHAPW